MTTKTENKKLTPRQEKVKKGIEYLIHYVGTYPNQYGYLGYSDETIIDDVLYGLGIALDDDEYQMAEGYRKFQERLLRHIQKNLGVG